MEERLSPISTTEIAFEILDSVYKMATRGEIVNPDETIGAMRKFTDGPRIELLRYQQRLYATVIETDGTERGFGIHRDGLADISFRDGKGNRVSINADGLEESDRKDFKNLSLRLVPWLVERYLNKEAKPLPSDIQDLYTRLATFKEGAEAKEILTFSEALAEDFNKRLGGQFIDGVYLKELSRNDMREAIGPMRDYWMSLDRAHKQFLSTSIRCASRGLSKFGEPEATVGDIRNIDVTILQDVRCLGPRRATFLKRAFARQQS